MAWGGGPWVFLYLMCPRLGAGGPRNAIGADKKAQSKPPKGPGKEPPTDTENCVTPPVLQQTSQAKLEQRLSERKTSALPRSRGGGTEEPELGPAPGCQWCQRRARGNLVSTPTRGNKGPSPSPLRWCQRRLSAE